MCAPQEHEHVFKSLPLHPKTSLQRLTDLEQEMETLRRTVAAMKKDIETIRLSVEDVIVDREITKQSND